MCTVKGLKWDCMPSSRRYAVYCVLFCQSPSEVGAIAKPKLETLSQLRVHAMVGLRR